MFGKFSLLLRGFCSPGRVWGIVGVKEEVQYARGYLREIFIE
jgi:hypothetical protein